MEIVASNSAADLARERALNDVQQTLAELAANLLRVIRGAGRPYQLPREAAEFVNAVVAFQETPGIGPLGLDAISALKIGYDTEARMEMSPENRMRTYAEERIVRGALQVAASQLLGQKTQEAAGESEMFAGMRDLEAHMAEQRRAWEAEVRARQAPKTRTKATRTKAQGDAKS